MLRWRNTALVLILATTFVPALVLMLDLSYPLNLPHQQQGFARLVVDRHGEPLRAFADQNGVWRYRVTLDQVSPFYLQALINYEDRWFYWHPGINPLALLRAAWQNLNSETVVSGGSTLTMQVARLLHPHPRTLLGKLQQALRALQLELHFSKEEILELYLNLAPFGGTREGVQTASYQYLGKPLAEVTRAEAALLAVLPQAPSRLRPDRYPQRAQAARDKLLARLQRFGVWTKMQVTEARKEQVAAFTPQRPMLAPLLARRLVDEYADAAVIHTHIDATLQSVLQQLASDYVGSQPSGTSVAMLLVENASHRVRAYVGSAELTSRSGYGYVDMVTAIRSPGSTLKPFLYGLAMDAGLVHSASLLADIPRTFSSYQPDNFNRGFTGPVSVEEALRSSLNVPAVEVLEHYGPARFAAKLENAGLSLHLPVNSQANLSMILGGVGSSLEDLVRGYGAFSSAGLVHPLSYIDRRYHSQTPAIASNNQGRYLFSPGAAWVIQRILQDVPRPGRINSQSVVGSATPVAWKSGTSYGYRDAWAIGLNADYTLGVWVGRPDGTPVPGHYGSLTAAPLLFAGFDALPAQTGNQLAQPHSVQQLDICWPLGLERESVQPQHCHQPKQAWVVDRVAPATLPLFSENKDWYQNPLQFTVNTQTGLRVDASCAVTSVKRQQVALWPNLLETWIEPRYRRSHQIPGYDPACPHPVSSYSGEMRIVGVANDTVLRSAGHSDQPPIISATVIGATGHRGWYLNGRKITTESLASQIKLELPDTGSYQLLVIDETGNLAKVEFRVI